MVAGAAGIFAFGALFVALVVPYRLWDSLAFGAWSRRIAAGEGILASADTPLFLQRPVFYVAQGLAWRILDEEAIGRLLSLSFVALLCVSVWILASRLSDHAEAGALLPPLALAVLLASSVLATHAASGMTDVPVAALVAATGAALWFARPSPVWIVSLGALAATAVLTKPSALLAFAGLLPAMLLVRGRRALLSLVGLGAGVLAALLYSAWQAARLDVDLRSFVTAGNDPFWLERGAAARLDALTRAEWLGEGLGLVVVLGLVHSAARATGARPRAALTVGVLAALAWSIVGSLVADGSLRYPFGESVVGTVAWLGLAAILVVASFLAHTDPIPERVHGALLLWLAPTALAWAWQRPDEARLLAPAWAPLVLVAAAGLTSVSLALIRLRPAAVYAPAGALVLLALANLPAIDGLGREGWRQLLELGPSGWRSRSAMENFAYGPFSYHLNLARENVRPNERIVSSDGRLTYFFPGQVELSYARRCEDLRGARFFSFLTAGESLEQAKLLGQPTNPLAWLQCRTPRLELVGEQHGVYAAFVVGRAPARAPRPEDCGISATGAELADAVFGERLSYAQARALVRDMESVGYEGVRLERTGCSEFRVVVAGIPEDERVRNEFSEQAASVGLAVRYTPALRFPEVSADVGPVAQR